MSDFNSKRCDMCGAIKGEANKWWIAGNDDVLFQIAPAHVESWNWDHMNTLDLCGSACLQKTLAEWMDRATKLREADRILYGEEAT